MNRFKLIGFWLIDRILLNFQSFSFIVSVIYYRYISNLMWNALYINWQNRFYLFLILIQVFLKVIELLIFIAMVCLGDTYHMETSQLFVMQIAWNGIYRTNFSLQNQLIICIRWDFHFLYCKFWLKSSLTAIPTVLFLKVP